MPEDASLSSKVEDVLRSWSGDQARFIKMLDRLAISGTGLVSPSETRAV